MSKKDTKQCKTTKDCNKYTQVKTVYARACIILLAFNFCLTGYVLNHVIQIQSDQTTTSSGATTPTPTLSIPASETPGVTVPTDNREFELKPDGSNAQK